MSSKTLIIGGKGYIGSALARVLDATVFEGRDYADCEASYLRGFDTLIMLAGHSSVAECIADPSGAWENNVSKFHRFLRMISDEQTLIYASSGSVYNRCENVTEENKYFYLTNTYDLTKFTIDQLASLSNKNFYGLRFGTVCGWSPRMRDDLMINKMYASRESGKIQVNNTAIDRPILALSDLVRAVQAIIADPDHPGIYNLASFTKTVGEIAYEVATTLDLEIEHTPPTPAYDFAMDTTKFQEQYNFMFQADLQSILTSLKNETII